MTVPSAAVEFKGTVTEKGLELFRTFRDSGELLTAESTIRKPPRAQECTCCAPGTQFLRHDKGTNGCKHAK